jgi:glucokinase
VGQLVLAGDIGGTKARLALFAVEGGRLRVEAASTEASREAPGLEALVARFAAGSGRTPVAACLGVAGPVRDNRVRATNLPWTVDAVALEDALGFRPVWLLNDLEAAAHGIAALGPGDVATLVAGDPEPDGNQAVIAAGTGLGEAGLVWDGRGRVPLASEGGHAGFAPVDDLQVELLRYLRAELGRVSVERVLSGPGLHNCYRFLRDTGRGQEPAWLAAELDGEDPPAAISRAALEARAPLAGLALDLFVAIYGAEAGDLALSMVATGGVYVAGGIAPRILPRLRGPAFLDAFRAKGRLRPLMERIPVHVVLRDDLALVGAARACAARAGLL